MYGWDDALGVMGTALHLAQSISIFIGLLYGMAKSDTVTLPHDLPRAGKVSALDSCSDFANICRLFSFLRFCLS